MNGIRKDIRDLITVNEKIQSAMSQGDSLSEDEAIIVHVCATELLEKVPITPPEPWYVDDNAGGKGNTTCRSVPER